MDEKSVRGMADYAIEVQKVLDNLTPWEKKERLRNSELRKRIKSGTVVVIPDGSDRLDDPLYQDAKILKR